MFDLSTSAIAVLLKLTNAICRNKPCAHQIVTIFVSVKSALAGLVLIIAPAAAQEFPPGVVDPYDAISDPVYSDPVFWWRMTNAPDNVFEPDPYFYWPEAVIFGPGSDFLPAANEGETSIPQADLEALASWAEERDTYALVIVHKGKVQFERYWQQGAPDAQTNGRAITRSITPMVLGFAVADGDLDLKDSIGKYITEWQDDPRGDITVRQLAQNSSGLEIAPSLGLEVIHGNKDLCLVYCGDVVRAALAYDKTSEPDVKFEVAQENMQLLALVIERAMGEPIQKILSERVWQKIGAADAAFQFDRPGGVARVMCCMRATPRDWARFGTLILDDGKWYGEQVLPEGWVDTMATPSLVNPRFGIGLWLGTPWVRMRTYWEGEPGVIPHVEPFVADDVRMMEGGGFRVIFTVPSEDLMILRLGNSQNPKWDHSYLVNTYLRTLWRDK
ncbi:MAG: serine hydrolase [Rhodospirillaceae bacterium]|nr:serine hydrolase [Rhodospirillaceae bacterium]MBT5239231.1 serine hydrolase [Rhodospirillaceae bacterium]MBT5566165.1 serine hydrolase [Rhodospirillaceae bacterium]MBT6090578.1 serine hydrolase [Rhodospirillaceae bacterium]MBT7451854.1 serine hydrolase [Rhodospirillaceae bacterium]